MSSYHTVQMQIDDQQVLMATLKQLGLTPRVAKQGKTLSGSYGLQAYIIVDKAQIGNYYDDLGFIKNKDGTFTVKVSNHSMQKFSVKLFDQKYKKNKIVKQLKKNKKYAKVKVQQQQDGTIKIRVKGL